MEVIVDSTRAWRQLPDCTRERHPILADQPTAADAFPHLWKVWLPHVGAVIIGHARTLTHTRAPRARASSPDTRPADRCHVGFTFSSVRVTTLCSGSRRTRTSTECRYVTAS